MQKIELKKPLKLVRQHNYRYKGEGLWLSVVASSLAIIGLLHIQYPKYSIMKKTTSGFAHSPCLSCEILDRHKLLDSNTNSAFSTLPTSDASVNNKQLNKLVYGLIIYHNIESFLALVLRKRNGYYRSEL